MYNTYNVAVVGFLSSTGVGEPTGSETESGSGGGCEGLGASRPVILRVGSGVTVVERMMVEIRFCLWLDELGKAFLVRECIARAWPQAR